MAKREWKRVAKDLHTCGLLTGVDRAALAAYCVAYGRWVAAETLLQRGSAPLVSVSEKGYVYPHPLLAVSNKAMELMHKFATEFGMTPSARARLTVQNTKPVDEFEEFVNQRT